MNGDMTGTADPSAVREWIWSLNRGMAADLSPLQISRLSTSIDLPPELWLEVFSNLSYRSLKIVQRVCRRFCQLLARSPDESSRSRTAIDRTLFKDYPVNLPKEQAPSRAYQLHPLLHGCVHIRKVVYDDKLGICVYARVTERLRLEGDKKYHIEQLFAEYYMEPARWKYSELMKENATSPATRYFHLEVTAAGLNGVKRSLSGPPTAEGGEESETLGTVLFVRILALYRLVYKMEGTPPERAFSTPVWQTGRVPDVASVWEVPPEPLLLARNDTVGMYRWLVARGTLVKKGPKGKDVSKWRKRTLREFGKIDEMPNDDKITASFEQMRAIHELFRTRARKRPSRRVKHPCSFT